MTSTFSISHPIDALSQALETITDEHHEIHQGHSYTVSDVQSVSTTTFKWQVTTPDTENFAHMIFQVDGTGEIFLVVTEGSDRTDGGALAEINRDRNSTETSDVIVTTTPTAGATDGATTILSIRAGATGQGAKTVEGGGSRGQNEFILKRNTKYVISVTTFAAIYVTLELNWYSHTAGGR